MLGQLANKLRSMGASLPHGTGPRRFGVTLAQAFEQTVLALTAIVTTAAVKLPNGLVRVLLR